MQRTRTYECMCLLDNREVRKGWQPLKDAITAQFTKHGAKILSSRRWDERRLAYPMSGQHRGTYLLVYLAVDTQAVAAIRRDLQFNESLLRWLLVFPSYGYLFSVRPAAASEILTRSSARGLSAAIVGTVDDSRSLRLRLGGQIGELAEIPLAPSREEN